VTLDGSCSFVCDGSSKWLCSLENHVHLHTHLSWSGLQVHIQVELLLQVEVVMRHMTRVARASCLPSIWTFNATDFHNFTLHPDFANLNMGIHIYAEHLINIRTLTIQVSLPTDSDDSTAISAAGEIFTVSHQDETAKIALPVSIPDSERVKLIIPSIPSRDLSFRVRLGDTSSPRDAQSSETIIPWTAASLSLQTELQCTVCHAAVLPRETIQTWKDLPSEGWAEMMEFWHCHKPNEPHNHEHQTDKKGYSANSTLAINPSVGLVNATSFVLAASDCKNIKVGPTRHAFPYKFPRTVTVSWALKRTGAFQPQGYYKWKNRDIAALKETFLDC
jgi:hypothetical protein